jgi:hypothetical protein
MANRPGYRPWLWGTSWPLVTRWAKDRPKRVVAYYVASGVLIIYVIVAETLRNGLAWMILGGVVFMFWLLDAGVHIPRACRAMRESARSN